jgi:hypothetical protein
MGQLLILYSGELEQTMMKQFCMSQNLRLLFSKHEMPASVDDLIGAFGASFSQRNRGTLLNDKFAFDALESTLNGPASRTPHRQLSDLPRDSYLLLRQLIALCNEPVVELDSLIPRAVMETEVNRLGETFSAASTSQGNSCIIFKEKSGEWTAGLIRDIFSHTRRQAKGTTLTETFIVVNQYASLRADHESLDHFRSFCVGGRIFYDRFRPCAVLLKADDVICPFAGAPLSVAGINEGCMYVLPLDKVFDSSVFSSFFTQRQQIYQGL